MLQVVHILSFYVKKKNNKTTQQQNLKVHQKGAGLPEQRRRGSGATQTGKQGAEFEVSELYREKTNDVAPP